MSDRLLIVVNRLPVTARITADGVNLVPSSGGLATGLRPWHEHSGAQWIGWPGDLVTPSAARREECDGELRQRRMVPVHLSSDQVERCYQGFANRVLWPLFTIHWTGYLSILRGGMPIGMSTRHSQTSAGQYRDNDTIWVHDYHLMLLPALLRERLPHARIGFFLRIPFPSSEVFRIFPWRREILDGVLGADLIGVHTFAYMRHFMTSLLRVDGVETDIAGGGWKLVRISRF